MVATQTTRYGATFVPCSPKHKSCSPSHAAQVQAYVEERQRQEIEHDGLWNAYGTGEFRIWKENGNHLITFREWLAGKGIQRKR